MLKTDITDDNLDDIVKNPGIYRSETKHCTIRRDSYTKMMMKNR